MKKILLVATMSVAGLVSAKNAEEKKRTKEVEKKEAVKEAESKEAEALKIQCINYGMFIECTGEVIPDQVCYGEGTGVASYEEAWDCITTNGTLANDYFCG
jgi:hypothetical protein